jgi:hypothetical protein
VRAVAGGAVVQLGIGPPQSMCVVWLAVYTSGWVSGDNTPRPALRLSLFFFLTRIFEISPKNGYSNIFINL